MVRRVIIDKSKLNNKNNENLNINVKNNENTKKRKTPKIDTKVMQKEILNEIIEENKKNFSEEEYIETRGKKGLKFNDYYLKRAYELSSCLLLECQIYESMDISADTFYTWKRERPEFAEALNKGRASTLEKLTKRAVERSENDPLLLMFLLKNKGKFIEHHQDKTIDLKRQELQIKKDELLIKEKEFQLKNEKFASELAEKFNLNKEEVLDLLMKNQKIPMNE